MDRRLYRAAMSGDVGSLKQLVGGDNRPETGILSHVTPQRNTALHLAAKRGHVDFVSQLLRLKPCLVLLPNSKQDTALHAAAMSGETKVVEVFLASEGHTYCTCSTPCVQLDLEQPPVDPRYFWKAQNLEKNTALHIAAKEGHDAIVELLLKKDERGLACVLNASGKSPLFIAAEYGRLRIVKRLLEVSTSICETNNDGETSLHAALRRGHADVAKVLLCKAPGLAIRTDKTGRMSPLHLASANGHFDIVGMMLEKHPETCYAITVHGDSAIHIAARWGHLKVIRELLSWNPDCIELSDKNGKTAMHLAVESKHWNVAWYLLRYSDASFLIDEGDKKGNTILHTMMSRPPLFRWFPMQRIMLTVQQTLSISRSSVNAENQDCQTALDIYRENAFSSVYGLQFLRAGARYGSEKRRKWRESQEEPEADPSEKCEYHAGRTGRPSKESVLENELDGMRNQLSIIAALLATVTFAAAFTPPGGVNSEGNAVLVERFAFKIFVISDTVAMCLSMLALCLLILPVHGLKGNRRGAIRSHSLSRMVLWSIEYAFVATLGTFATAIYLVVAPKCFALAFTVCVIIWFSCVLRNKLDEKCVQILTQK